MEQDIKNLLAILDKQIDQLITNMDMAQKILGDMVENNKKYQSGLLPEVEEDKLEESESVLPDSLEDLKEADDDLDLEKEADDLNDKETL